MKTEDLEKAFAPYRKPTEQTIPKFELIQQKTLELARLVNDECPESREKALALTHLQDARMWANAAIAIHS